MDQKTTHPEPEGNPSSKLCLGMAVGLAVGFVLSAVLGESRKAKDRRGAKEAPTAEAPTKESANEGDDQDRQSSDEEAEQRGHARQVRFLVVYYTSVLLFLFWLLFDIWSRSFRFLRAMGVSELALEEELIRTIGFTIIGGALGSILYHTRILYTHYCQDKDYSGRWFGKYVIAPWDGAALALIVLSLIRGGVSLFGGTPGIEVSPTNNFAAFGTGALVGFSMRDVVGWIQGLAATVFKLDGPEK